MATRRNVEIVVTMINRLTGQATQMETSVKKLRTGMERTSRTYNKFGNLVKEKTVFKKFTESQKKARIENARLNKIGREFGFFDVMRQGMPQFKKFNQSGRTYNRVGLKIAIVKVLWIKGIHGISFFQKSLMLGMRDFSDEYGKALKKDIIENIKLK